MQLLTGQTLFPSPYSSVRKVYDLGGGGRWRQKQKGCSASPFFAWLAGGDGLGEGESEGPPGTKEAVWGRRRSREGAIKYRDRKKEKGREGGIGPTRFSPSPASCVMGGKNRGRLLVRPMCASQGRGRGGMD